MFPAPSAALNCDQKRKFMTISSIINSIGLVLDIIGAMLLLKFGIPNKIDPEGTIHLIIGEKDTVEIEKGKRYKRWSNIAVFLIIIGFILQLISNFVQG